MQLKNKSPRRIVVAITGASGVRYGRRFLEHLSKLEAEADLIVSAGARKVFELEDGVIDLGDLEKLASQCHDDSNLGAEIASGSALVDGMVIIPCSMKSLSAIANDYEDNLISRVASVMLKEGKPLILVTRETPLSLIQLKNMTDACKAGAIVLPACPGFYCKPRSIDDLLDFVVCRVLDLLGLQHDIGCRWDPENR